MVFRRLALGRWQHAAPFVEANCVDADARFPGDLFYALPDTVADGIEGVYNRFTGQGLKFTSAAHRTC